MDGSVVFTIPQELISSSIYVAGGLVTATGGFFAARKTIRSLRKRKNQRAIRIQAEKEQWIKTERIELIERLGEWFPLYKSLAALPSCGDIRFETFKQAIFRLQEARLENPVPPLTVDAAVLFSKLFGFGTTDRVCAIGHLWEFIDPCLDFGNLCSKRNVYKTDASEKAAVRTSTPHSEAEQCNVDILTAKCRDKIIAQRLIARYAQKNIALGSKHSLILKPNGSIVACGANNVGQCDVPQPNMHFAQAAAGDHHSLGLKNDGSIVAWGDSLNGQCNVPADVGPVSAVAAGGRHSLCLKDNGSIVTWGYNQYGQCDVPTPNADFVAIATNFYHSLGLKNDGSIVAWGYNQQGQCNVPSPNKQFIGIAAGGFHSLGLKADGSIVVWGANFHGQLDRPGANSDFVMVSGGSWHSLGLKVDGSIVTWGYNELGECNALVPNSYFEAVASGGHHNLGIKADGSIVAWGENDYGQYNVPSQEAKSI